MPKQRSFHELRLKAGVSQASIFKKLGVPRCTVWNWDALGERPQWQRMLALANFFGIDVAEAVRLLWDETVGDRCACGCGGEKVFPCGESLPHRADREHGSA